MSTYRLCNQIRLLIYSPTSERFNDKYSNVTKKTMLPNSSFLFYLVYLFIKCNMSSM